MGGDQFLTPAELVKRWRGTVAENTLTNWRAMKTGPEFVKLRHKVLYPLTSVEAWEAANFVQTDKSDTGK